MIDFFVFFLTNKKMKWYTHLNKEDGDNSLLDYEVPETKTLIVCRELQYRNFAKFRDIFSFCSFLQNEVKITHRCYHECIFGYLPQKLYFDLDIPLKINNSPSEFVPVLGGFRQSEEIWGLSEDDSEYAMLTLINSIIKICPSIKLEDIMIFNSHGPSKRSYHIVVDNWYVPNARSNKYFFSKVMEIYPENLKRCVDHGLYKNVQSFRIYGCHKWNSTRIKTLDSNSKWQHCFNDEIITDRHLEFLILFNSLITNCSYCNILPITVPIEQKIYETFQISDDNVINILNMCATNESLDSYECQEFPYRVLEVNDNLISLGRNTPTYCKMCKRTHEHENPFIYIDRNGSVYFDCRRNEHKQKIKIGEIKVNIPVKEETKEEIEELEECQIPKKEEFNLIDKLKKNPRKIDINSMKFELIGR